MEGEAGLSTTAADNIVRSGKLCQNQPVALLDDIFGIRGPGAVLPDLHGIGPRTRRLCIAPREECPSSQDGARDNAKGQSG